MGQSFCDLMSPNKSKIIFNDKERVCQGCNKEIEAHVVREYINGKYIYWCSFKCFAENDKVIR